MNNRAIKSIGIILVVLVLMMGAGFYLLNVKYDAFFDSRKVESAMGEQIDHGDLEFKPAKSTEENKTKETEDTTATTEEEGKPAKTDQLSAVYDLEEEFHNLADQITKARDAKSSSVDSKDEEPAISPSILEKEDVDTVKAVVKPVVQTPVFSWGSSRSYTFKMEVKIQNQGIDTANNVTVTIPFLENKSVYQKTSLRSVNYDIVKTSGRMHTFKLGNIRPGETKNVVAEFDILVHKVSLNGTNETIEKARLAFDEYSRSGNCRELARGFVNKCKQLGVSAREVIGFARPERGPMTSGSLAGTRHSWAEFYVEGLGWVPVDLTFGYFGTFPKTSHVVESYRDQSIKINYSGGSLTGAWNNSIY